MTAWRSALLILSLCGSCLANAATYDPRSTFAPLDLPGSINGYRSGAGVPGAAYWQNRADYEIHGRLDTSTHSLSADETISYTNNSPDTLDLLWLQLDQNIYRLRSRSHAAQGGRPAAVTAGYSIDSVEVEQADRLITVKTVESDTRLQVWLPVPLTGSGGRVNVHVHYRFDIPGEFGGRMSWGKVKNGEIYDLAQWYPRMAVYDDVSGWDTLPYLDQEFYLEYGNFEYWVTVPSSMIVAGSGQLQNPEEVLTPIERQRLARAAVSDKSIAIVAPSEIGSHKARPNGAPTSTWHFRMENSRDAAFSASAAFAWDAARINLPGEKSALAMSYYPSESADAWSRSTAYVKDTVENMSRRWYPFPWPAAINVAGPTDGMEYPGLVFF